MTYSVDIPFELVFKHETLFNISVSKYRSKNTGLQVVFASVDAPIVHAYVAVATEESGDLIDKGLPHTLEHLVFLGSEDYPYKGVLDTLACKAFANGTNAWTAVDHTCYTISTAGDAGLLNILPIYLDHVLFPTLTEAGFITEVYHINGKGEDGGVVFTEMQGRENTSDDLCSHRMHQRLYPAPSGYGSETGGLMHKIRELDIEQIRKFHTQYYRPENLCVVVFGKVDPLKILQSILPLDQKIQSKPQLPPFNRPWVNKALPAFEKATKETILFPDEDETVGSLYIAFRGPAITDYEAIFQLDTLLIYLTDSPLSPLKQAFVEREDLICTEIDYEIHYYSTTSISLNFSSVYVEFLEKIPESLSVLLAGHKFDMNRMKDVIIRQKSILYDSVETYPADTLFRPMLTDFLYGLPNGSLFHRFSAHVACLDNQLELTVVDWESLISKYFLNKPSVTLLAKPSAEMVEKLANESKSLIKNRLDTFGPKKLSSLQSKLEEAMALNDLPVPDDMLQKFPCARPNIVFPKVNLAHFPNLHHLDTSLQRQLNQVTPLPFTVQLASISSRFISISTTWNITNCFPEYLIPYLGVYLELMFTSAVHPPSRAYMPYDQVVKGLDRDLVYYSNACGFHGDTFACGLYASQIIVSMRVVQENYFKAVQWLHWILFYSVVEWKRLSIVVKKLLGDIPQCKRDGPFMSSTFLRQSIFKENTTYIMLSLTEQESFLNALLEKILNKDPNVMVYFNEVRHYLHKMEHFRLSLVGNLESFPIANKKNNADSLLSPWLSFFPTTRDDPLLIKAPLPPTSSVASPYSLLNDLGRSPHSLARSGKFIILPAIESNFLCCISKGLDHLTHPDVPALMVALEFFAATEGLFWKHLRGSGLAYGCDLNLDLTTHHIFFSIYRSHDLFAAWNRACKVIEALEEGKLTLDPKFLDAAKSTLIYSLTSRVKSSLSTASLDFFQTFIQRLPKNYQQTLMDQVFKVTLEEVQTVAKLYLPGLFKPESCLMVAVCCPSKQEATLEGFKSIGFDLELVTLDDSDEKSCDDDSDEESD